MFGAKFNKSRPTTQQEDFDRQNLVGTVFQTFFSAEIARSKKRELAGSELFVNNSGDS